MFLKLGQVLVNGSSRLPNTHCKMKCARLGGAGSCCWVQQPACANSPGANIPAAKTGGKITIVSRWKY